MSWEQFHSISTNKGHLMVSGEQFSDAIRVDTSTIAIVCWKGRTSLCIMVSQLDGQELLERLSARFGCEKTSVRDEEKNGNLVMDAVENPGDHELGESNDGQELGDSVAANQETVIN